MKDTARIHSIQTLGTVDGPGIRTVVFFQGCPLRCSYCHNPDTWDFNGGEEITLSSLVSLVEEYKPYYGNDGGVTISGGECLFQADFVISFLKACQLKNIHTAIDTSGMTCNVRNNIISFSNVSNGYNNNNNNNNNNMKIDALVSPFDETDINKKKVFLHADLVILDLKFNNEFLYQKHTNGTLKEVCETLAVLESINKTVWIRQVIITGINDTLSDIQDLKNILKAFTCVKKTELLPFRKICIEKYENMNIEFPFENYPETSKEQIDILQNYYDSI